MIRNEFFIVVCSLILYLMLKRSEGYSTVAPLGLWYGENRK